MKNIRKIAIILALSLCLIVAFVACNDDDGFVYVTDEAGETVTDIDGNPVTAPDTDGDGQPDEQGSGVENAGANTEGGWGAIITPN